MKANLDGTIHLHHVRPEELDMVLTYLSDIFGHKTPQTIKVWGECIDDCPGFHEPIQRELMGHTVGASGGDDELIIEFDPPPYHRVTPVNREWKYITITLGKA